MDNNITVYCWHNDKENYIKTKCRISLSLSILSQAASTHKWWIIRVIPCLFGFTFEVYDVYDNYQTREECFDYLTANDPDDKYIKFNFGYDKYIYVCCDGDYDKNVATRQRLHIKRKGR